MTAPAPPVTDAHSTWALGARLRDLARRGAFVLPMPGSGHTRARFEGLARFGGLDLSLGRLAEAHTDAVAILAEAGRSVDQQTLLGVWAAGGRPNRVVATPVDDGWSLTGERHYCSGARLLDGALLTVEPADGSSEGLLLMVDLRAAGISIRDQAWQSPALADAATATVGFDDVRIAPEGLIGPRGFYLDRPGFWFGAIGVAAVWFGGAEAIAATVRSAVEDDPHALAHLGAIETACWGARAALDAAADAIDADPMDVAGEGARRALIVREIVERTCQEVVTRAGRALGPGPMAFDGAHAQRLMDLQLYVRQSHAERDLEEIGRRSREGNTEPR